MFCGFGLPFFVLALNHKTRKNLFFVRPELWFHVEQTVCYVCFGVFFLLARGFELALRRCSD